MVFNIVRMQRRHGTSEYKKVNKSADKKIMGDINVHCWRTNG